MDIKHSYDIYGNNEQSFIILAKPNKKLYCVVNGVDSSSVNITIRTNNTVEFTFDVDKYINGEKTNGYDYLEELMELYCSGIWFKISSPPIETNDGTRQIKQITAESYEIMLTQYMLNNFLINMGVDGSYEYEYQKTHDSTKFYQVKFYDPTEPKLSLLDLILSHADVPLWKIGYVDDITPDEEGIMLPDAICNFEVNEKNVYAFLTQEVSAAYKCIFEFDTINLLINVYRVDSLGKDTNIVLGFRNIQDKVTISRDDSLITQYYVEGLDGYDINSVNFMNSIITDLSYFVKEPYMSKELQRKYNAWINFRESKRAEFIQLSKQYNDALEVLSELQSRVPIDSAENDWFNLSVEELKEAYDANTAIIQGLESLYVDEEGNFDLEALKNSSDWSLYESIMNYTLPSIVAALQSKDEVVEGYGKGNIVSNVNPVTLGDDWTTIGSNVSTITPYQLNDSPSYGITRGIEIKTIDSSTYSGISQNSVVAESTQQYVLSCYAKGNGKIRLEYGSSGQSREYKEFDLNSVWTRVFVDFSAPSKLLGIAFTGNSNFNICGMQLEMGSIPSSFGYFTQDENILKAYETDWKLYGIDELETKLEVYENSIAELRKNGYSEPYSPLSKYEEAYHTQMYQKYLDYLNLKEECSKALDERKAEYEAAKPDTIQEQREKIANDVLIENFDQTICEIDYSPEINDYILEFNNEIIPSVQNNILIFNNFTPENIDGALSFIDSSKPIDLSFTEEEILLIKSLYSQANYTNENIISTSLDSTSDAVDKQKKLYDSAVEDLFVDAHPQYTYTDDIDNIYSLPEFKDFHDDLQVNNFIRLGINDYTYVKLRVIEITFNPFNMDELMQVTFSNMVQYKSKRNDFNTLIDESLNRISRNGGRVESVDKNTTTDYVITADVIKKLFSNPLFDSILGGTTVGGSGSGGTITAETIIAELVKADEGVFEKLTADTAFIKYLDSQLITSEKIVTSILEADEAVIKELSATIINASEINVDVANIKNLLAGNAGVGNLQTINLTAKNVTIDDAVIKDLIAAKISVADLMAHSATAQLITLISSDGKPTIAFQNSTQQFYDSSGNVRVQIGQDGNGNFNFVVRGKDGTTAIFDSEGIKREGIPDNTIINNMIEDATISKDKLGFQIVEPNEQGGIDITQIYDGSGELWGIQYESFKTETNNKLDELSKNIDTITLYADEQVFIEDNGIISPNEIKIYALTKGNTNVLHWYIDNIEQTEGVSEDKSYIIIPNTLLNNDKKSITIKASNETGEIYDLFTLYYISSGTDSISVIIYSSNGNIFNDDSIENTVLNCIVYKGINTIVPKNYNWYKQNNDDWILVSNESSYIVNTITMGNLENYKCQVEI